MAKRKGSSTPSCSRARKKAAEEGRDTKDDRDAREVENAKRLDKLPTELWEKILDHLDDINLFPLALSCRYFREKQKELLARPRQRELEWLESPHRALATDILRWSQKGQQASAEYLRFIRKEKVPRDGGRQKAKWIRCQAAYHGHLPLLQELLAGLKTLNARITQSAARGGQLETLQWLKTQKGFKLDTELFKFACHQGQMEVIKWLRSEGCPWSAQACKNAAMCGHFEILKWLRSEGCPWNTDACYYAAWNGHLEMLKWLRSEGCRWNANTYIGAAQEGHLEILKWLRSEGCPWDAGACSIAALYGHLETLKWLRSEGCPWTAQTCSAAAAGGHLETLKWLRSEGCPWDERTCRRAASFDHLDVLKYAREHGCPWDVWTWYHAGEATREWLMEIDCPWVHLDPDDLDPELVGDSDSEDDDIRRNLFFNRGH